MTVPIDAPIFVIGTHRSGTTLLGRALARHPEVAYWEEPRHVWSRGYNFRPDDVLEAAQATPRVAARIRREFSLFLAAAGRTRLAEKTPSNCLRLPFLWEIFPDAKFVHIFRDGRAVVHSTEQVTRMRKPETEWYARRLLGTPVWEWPALLPRAWRTLGRSLLGRGMAFWGPQPPGWREWLRRDSRLVVLAKQWRYTLEPVLSFRRQVPAAQWLDLRYEDVVREPARHANAMLRFARLGESGDFEQDFARECYRERAEAWRSQLDSSALAELRPILEPALERLGYGW